MSIEAMKLALEALEEINKLSIGENAICLPAEIDTGMDALRQAIAELESRKGWFEVNKDGYVQHKELSDEEIWKIYNITGLGNGMAVRFARAIIKEMNK